MIAGLILFWLFSGVLAINLTYSNLKEEGVEKLIKFDYAIFLFILIAGPIGYIVSWLIPLEFKDINL